MEENKTNEIIERKELITNTKFPYKYNNNLSQKGKYTNLFIKRIKRNSAQISPCSSSMTTTIKYEYTISKNNSIKENKLKNENDICYTQLNTTENILRTQSRILTNKPDDEFYLLKSEYTYRNKGFENFNMNKVCGSSHHKKKKNIMNQKLKQICKNNLNNLNYLKENIQVIKEYKLNYNYNNDITKGTENENINDQEQNNNKDENKNQILKTDYYINTDKNNQTEYDTNKKINHDSEIKFLPKFNSEIKTEKNSIYNTYSKSCKNIFPKKENLPYNLKYQIYNSTQKYQNDFNNFLKGYDVLFPKKNKKIEENNKTMDKIKLNKKYDFWNKYYRQNNSIRGNISKKREYYNSKFDWKFNKNFINPKINSINKTMHLINKYGNYKKEKCVLPPNNLRNIILKREKEFFEL